MRFFSCYLYLNKIICFLYHYYFYLVLIWSESYEFIKYLIVLKINDDVNNLFEITYSLNCCPATLLNIEDGGYIRQFAAFAQHINTNFVKRNK